MYSHVWFGYLQSAPFEPDAIKAYDCILVVTNHTAIDMKVKACACMLRVFFFLHLGVSLGVHVDA